jgi:hypothetical protein
MPLGSEFEVVSLPLKYLACSIFLLERLLAGRLELAGLLAPSELLLGEVSINNGLRTFAKS